MSGEFHKTKLWGDFWASFGRLLNDTGTSSSLLSPLGGGENVLPKSGYPRCGNDDDGDGDDDDENDDGDDATARRADRDGLFFFNHSKTHAYCKLQSFETSTFEYECFFMPAVRLI